MDEPADNNQAGIRARPYWQPPKKKLARLLIVLAGIVLGQAIIYGPSFIGLKILLPLDILAEPKFYLPQTPEVTRIRPKNPYLIDPVCYFEPARRFAISEYRAGRLPMWSPSQYAGAPFIWPKFSPFLALQCVTESPIILAWTQLLAALVAGTGMYLFCCRVLALGFWPSAIAAWCYPLIGFFTLWLGSATGLSPYWLPWLLLAIDGTVRRTNPWAALGVAIATALVVLSGHLDVASQVLLTSGIFACWCLLDAWPKPWLKRQAYQAVGAVVIAWVLGFFLAAPQVLPTVAYAHTGVRFERRSAGTEERPPVGLAALPQIVLPKMHGSTETGSFPLFPKGQANLSEGSAAAYTGLLASLFLAPLAFCSRRHRSFNLFSVILCVLTLAWTLNIPGLVQLFRLPGLNMLSHNRFVFAASFALLSLAAIGFEVLLNALHNTDVPNDRNRESQSRAGKPRGATAVRTSKNPTQPFPWPRWLWLPVIILALIYLWSVYRAVILPEPIRTQLAGALVEGKPMMPANSLAVIEEMQVWFAQHYAFTAVLSAIGLALWLCLRFRPFFLRRVLPALPLLLAADLLWFARGLVIQSDPKLYYPEIPALDELAKSAPGRVIGYHCLPAWLASMRGLNDIRGYDAVDPASLTRLLTIAGDERSYRFEYALTQWLTPQAVPGPENTVRLPPVLDMLGVTHVVFRGSPPAQIKPAFQSFDYWILPNPSALPRAFIPERVECIPEGETRLKAIASPQFNPRAVAYVESPVTLPDSCHGTARISSETPVQITVSVNMETAGLLVLSDLWDKGWHALLNRKPVPILRANNTIRGVVVPPGSSTLEFRYQPASFALGIRLCAFAALLLAGWAAFATWQRAPNRQ